MTNVPSPLVFKASAFSCILVPKQPLPGGPRDEEYLPWLFPTLSFHSESISGCAPKVSSAQVFLFVLFVCYFIFLR